MTDKKKDTSWNPHNWRHDTVYSGFTPKRRWQPKDKPKIRTLQPEEWGNTNNRTEE